MIKKMNWNLQAPQCKEAPRPPFPSLSADFVLIRMARYIVTPTHNGERKGEKEVLESTAGQLGLSVDSTEYEPVADDAFDEDYTDSGKGSIEVSWEDEGDDVKVRVFDQDK